LNSKPISHINSLEEKDKIISDLEYENDEKENALKSFESKVEFLEQTHIKKDKFLEKKEGHYVKTINQLHQLIDKLKDKEKHTKEGADAKLQKWKLKCQHLEVCIRWLYPSYLLCPLELNHIDQVKWWVGVAEHLQLINGADPWS